MQVESRTDNVLTFAPWERGKRVRSFVGGSGLFLIGVASPVVFGPLPVVSGESIGWGWLIAAVVGLSFAWSGLNHLVQALPLQLEIRRHPVGSCLRWRGWRFRSTQFQQVDNILIAVHRGQRGARYFALHFRSVNAHRLFFRSFEYWRGTREALRHAEPMARNIADFLSCSVEFEK